MKKLGWLVGGDPYSKNEKLDYAARNYGFELRIAAYFLKAGFAVDLSTLSDILVDYEGRPLHVECKRLASRSQVERRIKEVARQLKERCGGGAFLGRKALGLAALEVSRIVNPKQGLTVAPDARGSRDGLRAQLVGFAEEYHPTQYFAGNKKAISVWVQMMAPVAHRDGIATRFSSIHLSLGDPGTSRGRMFESLKRVFEISDAGFGL